MFTILIFLTSFFNKMTCTCNKPFSPSGPVFLELSGCEQRRQQRDRYERRCPFGDYLGSALVSGVKSELQIMDAALRFKRSMGSEKAGDSWDFTKNHQTTDLAILQFLASKSRIVLCFFSGNSSYSERVYTLGQIASQFSTAHAGGQDCSPWLRLVRKNMQALLMDSRWNG